MKRLLFVAVLLSVTIAAMGQKPSKKSLKRVDDALELSLEHSKYLYSLVEADKKAMPQSIEKGELLTSNIAWWTSGFFPGTLWYLYESSGDESLIAMADDVTERVLPQQYTKTHHDVGFMLNCSAGNGYRLTGNQTYKSALKNAAKSLSTRFSPSVGAIRSWDNPKWEYPVIIDNMMNLELMFVASSMFDIPYYETIAVSHADKTMQCHYRDDASCYHVIDYDSKSGDVLSAVTHQGYADDSAWSRGQAWGLYGYVLMYRFTGDQKYLDWAGKITKFLVEHPNMPDDLVPYWDFDAPGIPNALRDVSAASVICSAWIEMSQYLEGAESKAIFALAEKQLNSLMSDKYMEKTVGENCGFILKHSVGFMNKNSEIDVPLSYADYYFVEALMRMKNYGSMRK